MRYFKVYEILDSGSVPGTGVAIGTLGSPFLLKAKSMTAAVEALNSPSASAYAGKIFYIEEASYSTIWRKDPNEVPEG